MATTRVSRSYHEESLKGCYSCRVPKGSSRSGLSAGRAASPGRKLGEKAQDGVEAKVTALQQQSSNWRLEACRVYHACNGSSSHNVHHHHHHHHDGCFSHTLPGLGQVEVLRMLDGSPFTPKCEVHTSQSGQGFRGTGHTNTEPAKISSERLTVLVALETPPCCIMDSLGHAMHATQATHIPHLQLCDLFMMSGWP